MRVETYSDRYFQDVVKLVEKFYEEHLKEIYGKAERKVIFETINRFSGENSQNAFLLIVDGSCVGLLAGVELKSEINNEKFFQEILWCIEKPYGQNFRYLIKRAQIMLQSRGFSIIIMAVIENSKSLKVERIYQRIGFNKLETHYMRKL